jgi:hypothetical protein
VGSWPGWSSWGLPGGPPGGQGPECGGRSGAKPGYGSPAGLCVVCAGRWPIYRVCGGRGPATRQLCQLPLWQ